MPVTKSWWNNCSPFRVRCTPSLEKQSLSAVVDKDERRIKWTLFNGVIRDGRIPFEKMSCCDQRRDQATSNLSICHPFIWCGSNQPDATRTQSHKHKTCFQWTWNSYFTLKGWGWESWDKASSNSRQIRCQRESNLICHVLMKGRANLNLFQTNKIFHLNYSLLFYILQCLFPWPAVLFIQIYFHLPIFLRSLFAQI